MKQQYFFIAAFLSLAVGVCGQLQAAAPYDTEIAMSKCTKETAPAAGQPQDSGNVESSDSPKNSDSPKGGCGCGQANACGGNNCNSNDCKNGRCTKGQQSDAASEAPQGRQSAAKKAMQGY